MYLQITERCNMTCAHCCMSATKKGEDMSLQVVRAALEHVSGFVTIGGGEPTMHPKFEEILFECLGHPYVEGCGIFIATNGTHILRARVLLKMAKDGVLDVQLSEDEFHDWNMVDPEIRTAYRKMGKIRDVTNGGYHEHLSPTGRARELLGFDEDDEQPAYNEWGCCCETHMVKPNGDVYQCGCDDAPLIGNVLEGNYDGEYEGMCCNSPEYIMLNEDEAA